MSTHAGERRKNAVPGPDRWTARQREFVRLFHDRDDPRRTCCCATRAAAAAGYRWPGKSGPRLMTYPHIRAEVDRRLAETIERLRAERMAAIRRQMARLLT